uniref:Uncharacterized protein n=1 Tax=Brassica campestris TaxID=3711 RepID=A0A3P6CD45_BRACM|nr:unnamed protein product [Brassica rapa]
MIMMLTRSILKKKTEKNWQRVRWSNWLRREIFSSTKQF